MTLSVEIVPVAEIQPSAYNPRQVFPDRLRLVELSLSRFGFLLPLYVDPDGEILSGHQRHYVATERLGATHVPVVRTRALTKKQARALNMVFNRATNDLAVADNMEPLSKALAESDLPAQVEALPPLRVDLPEFMPIVDAQPANVRDILDANPVWTDLHGISMATKMVKLGHIDMMPIVVTPSLRIINGAARVAAAARKDVKQIPVVVIPEERADLAHGLLNLLSMKYELSTGLADDLRAYAFRAAPSVRHSMSFNSIHDLTRGKASSRYFDPLKPEHAKAWVEHYGPRTLDFGAGMYWDFKHAELMGADAVAFEPYYDFDREKARAAAEANFFSRLDGRPFNSIFLSNVMNSVPFEGDRQKICTIVNALAWGRQEDPLTTVFASGRSSESVSVVNSSRRLSYGEGASGAVTVENETGVRVTSLDVQPLVQKFHNRQEFASMWRSHFRKVEHDQLSSAVVVRCRKPRPIDLGRLADAIEFEFDLPFADGTRLGLVAEAKEAIGRHIGTRIP